MSKNYQNQISCPNCQHNIDVNQILYGEISEEIKNDYRKKMSEEKKQLEQKLRKEIIEEKDIELSSYKDELKRKTEQVRDFSRLKTELERTIREKSVLKEEIEAEFEQKMTRQLNEEKSRIKKEVDEKALLKIYEKEHIIEQLKEQLTIAQRKAEQGSTQLQGEVHEQAIEDILEGAFRFDSIEPIEKGKKGGDCVQKIVNNRGQHCGTILYEAKRVKNFSDSFIQKIKADMQIVKADVGVIITETFPRDMNKLGIKDGIWIISFSDVQTVALLLREGILKIHEATLSQENKGTKMSMLYNFLISNEFRLQITAILDTFSTMQNDLNKERRAIEGLWKKREKQIEAVLLNTSHLFNSVKGIASEIGPIELLELPAE